MFEKKCIIPYTYQIMEQRGYTIAESASYVWLNEMEWIPIEKIKEYKQGKK